MNAITLEVWYDGCFLFQPLRYANGSKITIITPESTFQELFEYLENETGNPLSAIYYLLPDCTLESGKGLRKVQTEEETDDLFIVGYTYGTIIVYLDHFGDDISGYLDDKECEGVEIGEASRVNNDEKADNVIENDDGTDSVNESSEEDAKSLDNLSEGEDEVEEIRKGKGKKIRLPKDFNLKNEVPNNGDDEVSDHEVADDNLLEHQQFMNQLSQAFQTHDYGQINVDETEDEQVVKPEYPIHDSTTNWKLKKPMVGEKYENHAQLKECLIHYALANGFSIWYERSSTTLLLARCGKRPSKLKRPEKGQQWVKHKDVEITPDCPWRLWATVIDEMGSFQVKSLNDLHTCARNFKYGKLMNYKWIAKEFGHHIRQNPQIRLIDLADLVMKKYKCSVSDNQCYKARSWAMNMYEKSLVEHYGLLWDYGEEILKKNPGSTVNMSVSVNPDEVTYFDKFYVCLHGLKEGWKMGCRSVIGLDGCFLKTICQGQLLTAIGKDGNNHIFPLAWAVVTVENKENWEWFLKLLVEDIDMPEGNGLTLMSDQHKGLLEAVKNVMPHAEHRQCARHIYENFKKQYGGVEFRRLFWAASKATYPPLFNNIMDEIKLANPCAYQYLMERNPKSWSRAFFELGRGCDSIENGFSECFNSILLTVRNKPIITMLEGIRVILMEMMNSMREACINWHDVLCPSIRKKIKSLKEQHRHWHVIPSGGNRFEVRQGLYSFDVDEYKRTCSCRQWELSGLPCPHAMAVIFKVNKQPEDYVPCWFRTENYMKAYMFNINPLGGMEMWEKTQYKKPLPPKERRMPGRPKKRRIRHQNEGDRPSKKPLQESVKIVSRKGSIMRCQNCFKQGHNRKSCKEEKQDPPKRDAKRVGRPRKDASGGSMTVGGSSGGSKTVVGSSGGSKTAVGSSGAGSRTVGGSSGGSKTAVGSIGAGSRTVMGSSGAGSSGGSRTVSGARAAGSIRMRGNAKRGTRRGAMSWFSSGGVPIQYPMQQQEPNQEDPIQENQVDQGPTQVEVQTQEEPIQPEIPHEEVPIQADEDDQEDEVPDLKIRGKSQRVLINKVKKKVGGPRSSFDNVQTLD